MTTKTNLKALMITIATISAAPALADNLCLSRHYDAGHLSKHPDQLITTMTLALDPDGPASRGTRTLDEGGVKIAYDFKIAMTKRGDNNLYVQQGYVENRNEQYRGVVECDGGGFTLEKLSLGALLTIGSGPGGGKTIRMAIVPDPCGESNRVNNSVDIGQGKDDRTFRLNTASPKVCSQLFDKIDWNAAATPQNEGTE